MREDCEKMVIFDPTNPTAYGYCVTLFLKCFGDTEQTRIDWETVCNLSMCEHYPSAIPTGHCEPLG